MEKNITELMRVIAILIVIAKYCIKYTTKEKLLIMNVVHIRLQNTATKNLSLSTMRRNQVTGDEFFTANSSASKK